MSDDIGNSNQDQSHGPIQPAAFKPVAGGSLPTKAWVKPVAVIFLLLLALLTAVLWYLFSARSVALSFEPEAHSVQIKGGLAFKLGDRYLLREGDYRIRATADGYRPFEGELQVGSRQNQHYDFKFLKLPGLLNIQTQPQNAQVTIDQQQVGLTPLNGIALEPGQHSVEVNLAGHIPQSATVQIEGANQVQSLAIELSPAWADVIFESIPASAQVLVDGELRGTTPVTLQIMQGEHGVELQAPGYSDWRRSILVQANQEQAFTAIKLEPAATVVKVTTEPDKANITLDGQFLGQSPLEIKLTPGKQHRIELFKPGYEKAGRTLSAESVAGQTLSISMQPTLGEIRIISTPADADLYVNGVLKGKTGQTIALPAIRQNLEVRKLGYLSWSAQVTPRQGLEQQLQVRLQTPQQAKLLAQKPEITTAAGQRLKLFRSGQITLGASRREAGRRANEVLRKVSITRAFYMGLHEVTNAQFRLFRGEHSSGQVKSNSLDGDTQPVVMIGWEDAALYCNWLSERASLPLAYRVQKGKVVGFNAGATGYRLPTEAEWAWSARDTRQGPLKYPWGADMPPGARSGNYADRSAADLIGRIADTYNDGYAVTAPVGSFTANEKGLYDMGGNVAEWINDYYGTQMSLGAQLEKDPIGPAQGQYHVIRGSSWAHGSVTELRLSFRDYGDAPRNDLGFRIARYVE